MDSMNKQPIVINFVDLPEGKFCCPLPYEQDNLWSEHPRVYYPLQQDKEINFITCVWCSKNYKIQKSI